MDAENRERRNRTQWEKRSGAWGASLKSVLFKGLPLPINEHLHDWHLRQVVAALKELPTGVILDVGCGYGRLTSGIQDDLPRAKIFGVDVAQNYLRLYHDTGCSGVRAQVEDLPIKPGTFDSVVCVTVLMYVAQDQLHNAVENLVRVVKPGGKLVVIEPHHSGIPFQTAFGLLRGFRRKPADNFDTGGSHFRGNTLRELLGHHGAKVQIERRLPVTTILLLPMYAVSRLAPPGLVRTLLGGAASLDRVLGGSKLPTIYVSYVATVGGEVSRGPS